MTIESPGIPGVIPDIEISALVGEMPAYKCEEQYHSYSSSNRHADGNEQYVNWHGHKVTIYCGAYIAWMQSVGEWAAVCKTCDARGPLNTMFTVLGPANGGKP